MCDVALEHGLKEIVLKEFVADFSLTIGEVKVKDEFVIEERLSTMQLRGFSRKYNMTKDDQYCTLIEHDIESISM